MTAGTPTAGSLCSGIGGLDLGLERAGWQIAYQVENDPFCQAVLAKHWPTVPRWGDLKELDPHDLPRTDLLVAGFPCQPVSDAGRQLAQADQRWLWPWVAGCIRVLRPRLVLLENVPGLLARGFGDVLGDLAALGMDAEWVSVGADAVGAPHQRHRVWVVAYPAGRRHGRPDDEGRRPARGGGAGAGGAAVADAEGERWAEGWAEPALRQRRDEFAECGAALADAGGARLEVLSQQPARQERPAAQRNGAAVGDANGQRRPEWARAYGRGGTELADAGGVGDAEGQRRRWERQREGQPRTPTQPDRPGAERTQPVLGRVLDGLPGRLDGHRWPAPPGAQHEWEPPRTVTARQVPNRAKRIQALGNAVVPQLAELIGRALRDELAARGAPGP